MWDGVVRRMSRREPTDYARSTGEVWDGDWILERAGSVFRARIAIGRRKREFLID